MNWIDTQCLRWHIRLCDLRTDRFPNFLSVESTASTPHFFSMFLWSLRTLVGVVSAPPKTHNTISCLLRLHET